jgi:hypothetical protein
VYPVSQEDVMVTGAPNDLDKQEAIRARSGATIVLRQQAQNKRWLDFARHDSLNM